MFILFFLREISFLYIYKNYLTCPIFSRYSFFIYYYIFIVVYLFLDLHITYFSIVVYLFLDLRITYFSIL